MLDEFSEYIDCIHPLNAQHLLLSEPHRLYGREGDTLELLVERFAHAVGGIIAIGYYDASIKSHSEEILILRPDGHIRQFDTLSDKEVP